MALAFLTLAILCWSLLLFPYLLYPVVLSVMRKQSIRADENDYTVSLLFCAYNEAASIEAKIANLRTLKRQSPDLEILAFDDGSTDGTRFFLENAADLLTLVKGEGRQGKASGMKRLASQARGDILVFTDANVICRPDIIERIAPYYSDEDIGGVCGSLRYENEEWSATAEVNAEYWRLDEMLRSLESATGNVMGADGSIFSVRRALYPEFPDTVLDDFVVSMSVIFAGRRLIKADDVVAFEESVTRSDEEFQRKIRIGTRAYHTHLWMRNALRGMSAVDRFKYLSRKHLRWFGAGFLIVGLVFALLGVAQLSTTLSIIATGISTLAIGLALTKRSGPFAKAGEILRGLTGMMIGVLRGMRGQIVQTWSPAISR